MPLISWKIFPSCFSLFDRPKDLVRLSKHRLLLLAVDHVLFLHNIPGYQVCLVHYLLELLFLKHNKDYGLEIK